MKLKNEPYAWQNGKNCQLETSRVDEFNNRYFFIRGGKTRDFEREIFSIFVDFCYEKQGVDGGLSRVLDFRRVC